MRSLLSVILVLHLTLATAHAQFNQPPANEGDRLLAEYFHNQTRQLSEKTFADIQTLDDWTSRRDEYRLQLLEMLGLSPMPEKTPLQPVVTQTQENEGVIVENIQFQSSPGLYVTANLYRPKEQTGKLPAILYVCGHGREAVDGVSLGNKTHYQHHGGWFARNGYVCLIIDTIQLGEIEGIHHGTYREKMWWWNNRGYTPAGVEAWNCVRSLDYLQSREEVDGDRIGVTGRSGGGAYSWWISAIDERIKVSVPVAGITTLKNHVVDGCVEGHCDCMYFVNTYRWDYPMVAAMVAPRPLLIENSDKDRIFPLDGVVDLHAKVRHIYRLYDAEENLGLHVTEGPHKDTQELRIGAFHWFNRFLKKQDPLIETTATPLFEKKDLKVFESLPDDQRVTTIHETFVPQAKADQAIATGDLKEAIRERSFGGWPNEPEDLTLEVVQTHPVNEAFRLIEFTSQAPYRLRICLHQRPTDEKIPLRVIVLNDAGWKQWGPMLAALFPKQFSDIEPNEALLKEFEQQTELVNHAFVMPRGIGPTAWTDDERERTHVRRRFMLLGQTLGGMQVYDLCRAVEALQHVDGLLTDGEDMQFHASGDAAIWALYAALFADGVDGLVLSDLPKSNRDAPDLLNISRFATLDQVIELARQHVDHLNVRNRR
ncbi:alpha/beta hydrolase family protein [Stieleria varia]|uniref:Acetyl xylan esterase (AXE1) n=1 Tax=Stieleria varia TaxID=2528005 RepID=A0A5C6A5X7_9BACT|nr:acetylxylan esterase [Stieleria varia]TWT94471.1 Acetyl xylan esterase (AXE1) [Stieleria varia]